MMENETKIHPEALNDKIGRRGEGTGASSTETDKVGVRMVTANEKKRKRLPALMSIATYWNWQMCCGNKEIEGSSNRLGPSQPRQQHRQQHRHCPINIHKWPDTANHIKKKKIILVLFLIVFFYFCSFVLFFSSVCHFTAHPAWACHK